MIAIIRMIIRIHQYPHPSSSGVGVEIGPGTELGLGGL
jgi:hypothetical protein